MIAQVF